MAQSTRDAHAGEHVLAADGLDGTLHPHDGIELEKRDGGRGIRQADRPVGDTLDDLGWKRVDVDLEPDPEGSRRIHRGRDDLVETESVGPERLVAEGVEPEDFLPLSDQSAVVLASIHDEGRDGKEDRRDCSNGPEDSEPLHRPIPR